ncbi:hypothetical protein KAU08_11730 [bacterium]|nr:hypothetical protein [bacterium]
MENRIPAIVLLALLGIFIGCGGGGGNGGGPKLIVGDISGPATILETSSADYSITATGDTGITYLWAVDPPGAGILSPQNAETTNFTASEVDTDTPAVITVVVNSDNDGPIIKSIEITIEDSAPQNNPDPELLVGEITGPLSGDEYSSWTYSVAASGDSGITYEWSSDPLDVGNFENPNVAEPLYSTYGVEVDTDVEIRVAVNSDNFGPVIRTMTTTVLDSINPAQYLGGGHPIEGVNYYRNNRSSYPLPVDLASDDFIEGLYGEYDSFRDLLISEDESLFLSHNYKYVVGSYISESKKYNYVRSFLFGEDTGEAVQTGYRMVLTDSGLYSITRSRQSSYQHYAGHASGSGGFGSGLDKYGAWPTLEQQIATGWGYTIMVDVYYYWQGDLEGMHIFDVFPLPDGSTLIAFARSGNYFGDPPTYIAFLDGSFNTVYETDLLTEIRGISFDEPTGHIYISTITGLYCYDLNMNQLWDTTATSPSFSSTFAVITDDGGAIGVGNGQLKRVEPDGSIGTVVDCGPYLRPAITNNGSVLVITADTLQIYDSDLNLISEFPLPTGPGTGEIYTKTPLIGSDGNIALTTDTDLYILNGSGTEIAHRTFDAKIHGLRLGPQHLFVATENRIYRFGN